MTDSISAQRLKSFIRRIENLEEEKKTLGTDIKEVYAEAKSSGYDPKIMREVVRVRRINKADRAEQQALFDIYMEAVGDFASTPLGQAAAPTKPADPPVTPVRRPPRGAIPAPPVVHQ